MNLKSEIWGPHYWFILHTIAYTYPDSPDKSTKKKYYNFMINFPFFLPNSESEKNMTELLKSYPVSSYLDSRESFMKYIYFIHNHFNEILNKPKLNYDDAWNKYLKQYEISYKDKIKKYKLYKKLLFAIIMLLLILIIIIKK